MSARGWGAGDHESGTEREPRRPSGRQCCQMCLRTSKRHILHLSTYRNRCSKHRQRGDQDHVVDVVQRNNVCKHKLLYKSTWTMDPVGKCSVLFSSSLGTFDVLHCRAIQTLWTKRLRLSVWKFNFWQLSFWIQGQALEVKSIEIRFMLGVISIGHLQFRTCNLRFLNPSWICVDLGIWLTLWFCSGWGEVNWWGVSSETRFLSGLFYVGTA